MSHWLDEPRDRQDVVTIPRLWVTVALSILIHVAVLFIWIPRTHLLTPGDQEQDQLTDRLQVRLAAPPPPGERDRDRLPTGLRVPPPPPPPPPPPASPPQTQASLQSPPKQPPR